MNLRADNKIIITSFTAAVMALLLWAFGYYLEVYEVFISNIVSATFCDPPVHLWLSTIHTFLFPVYGKLHQWFPSVPIIGVVGLLLMFAGLCSINTLLAQLMQRRSVPLVLILLGLLVIDINLFADSIVLFNSTRLSILLVAIAMLVMLERNKESEPSLFSGILLWMVLLAGCLMRVQTGAVAAVFVFVALFVLGQPLVKLLKLYTPVFIILAGLWGVYHHDRVTTTNFGKVIEDRYEYAIVDQHAMVPLSDMKTHRDSIRYQAVEAFMLNDPAVITPSFLDSVVVTKSKLSVYGYGGLQWQALLVLQDLAREHAYKLVFLLLVFLGGILSLNNKVGTAFRYLLVLLGLGLLLSAMTFYANLPARVFSPLVSVAALCLLYHIITTNGRGNVTLLIFFIAVLITLPLGIKAIKQQAQQQEGKQLAHQRIMAEMKPVMAGKQLVILGFHDLLFSNQVFAEQDTALVSQWILPDISYMEYYGFLRNHHRRLYGFNSTDMASIGRFLIQNKEHLVVYAAKNRAALYQQYLQEIHHLPIHLKWLQPALGDQSDEWGYFAIETTGQ